MPSGNGDVQVIAAERIIQPQSVLDAVLSAADAKRYDAANPFMLRVVFCGRKKGVGFSAMLEKILSEAKNESDADNPFANGQSDAQIGVMTIDYGEYFLQVVDGPESYVLRYSEKLSGLQFVESASVRILYLDDDILQAACSGVTIIDKVPPSSLTISSSERMADEIADLVVHDVTSAIELATQASGQAARMKGVFTDNAKINYPKLFPRVELLLAYIKSDSFFTLEEFVTEFCKPANLVREVEIAHPAEDPLSY